MSKERHGPLQHLEGDIDLVNSNDIDPFYTGEFTDSDLESDTQRDTEMLGLENNLPNPLIIEEDKSTLIAEYPIITNHAMTEIREVERQESVSPENMEVAFEIANSGVGKLYHARGTSLEQIPYSMLGAGRPMNTMPNLYMGPDHNKSLGSEDLSDERHIVLGSRGKTDAIDVKPLSPPPARISQIYGSRSNSIESPSTVRVPLVNMLLCPSSVEYPMENLDIQGGEDVIDEKTSRNNTEVIRNMGVEKQQEFSKYSMDYDILSSKEEISNRKKEKSSILELDEEYGKSRRRGVTTYESAPFSTLKSRQINTRNLKLSVVKSDHGEDDFELMDKFVDYSATPTMSVANRKSLFQKSHALSVTNLFTVTDNMTTLQGEMIEEWLPNFDPDLNYDIKRNSRINIKTELAAMWDKYEKLKIHMNKLSDQIMEINLSKIQVENSRSPPSSRGIIPGGTLKEGLKHSSVQIDIREIDETKAFPNDNVHSTYINRKFVLSSNEELGITKNIADLKALKSQHLSTPTPTNRPETALLGFIDHLGSFILNLGEVYTETFEQEFQLGFFQKISFDIKKRNLILAQKSAWKILENILQTSADGLMKRNKNWRKEENRISYKKVRQILNLDKFTNIEAQNGYLVRYTSCNHPPLLEGRIIQHIFNTYSEHICRIEIQKK